MSKPVERQASEVIERHEMLVPQPAIALAGMLNIDDPPARATKDPVPLLWHWIYLLERHREDELGSDGHALHGIPAPPAPGRLRMFAGGRVSIRTPLRIGEQASRVTRIASTTEKQGRSGPLTFVTTRSEFLQNGEVAIIEEQDIVYREPGSRLRQEASAASTTPLQPDGETDPLELDIDPVLLFRFSALTYNAHRIHYDQAYIKAEGYPGLVVHGPLQALLMAERLRREGISPVGQQFGYRLLTPTYGPTRLRVSHRQTPEAIEVSVHDGAGVRTATARLTDAQLG